MNFKQNLSIGNGCTSELNVITMLENVPEYNLNIIHINKIKF